MKNDINTTLEEFARKYLSPAQPERDAISRRYQQLREILPGWEIFQNGSYPRETSITPVHDLDVIWVMPDSWQNQINKAFASATLRGQALTFDVTQPLSELAVFLRREYAKIGETVEIDDSQTHSVKISFPKTEVFSIDVVPAAKSGKKNRYGDDIYLVPEIQQARHKRWSEIYKQRGGKLLWILSDPKFYVKQAAGLNSSNTSYRKSVKFAKVWRRACNTGLTDFELQSFHMELILADIFKNSPNINMHRAVVQFLTELPVRLQQPAIADAANPNVFIDDYLDKDTSGGQRKLASAFANETLTRLQELGDNLTFEEIYSILREALVAQTPWPTSQNVVSFEIECVAELRKKRKNSSDWRYHGYNLPKWTLDEINAPKTLTSGEAVKPGYNLTFTPLTNGLVADEIKWLVVNTGTDPLEQDRIAGWRGLEFHDCEEGTNQRLEYTRYVGQHWIQCFYLSEGVCVGHGRFYVNIVPG